MSSQEDRCLRCDGEGWVEVEPGRLASCDCRDRDIELQRRKSIQRRLRDRVPERYQHLAFDRNPVASIKHDHPAAVRAVRNYCEELPKSVSDGTGLWLFGNKGTGKTTLAYLITTRALEMGFSVSRWSTIDLLNRLRSSYRDDARPTTEEIIDAAATVDLLQLEDVGVPRPTDWVLEQLYTIVNHRYEDKRPIVFTSDLPYGNPPDPDALAAAIGERTYSRLFEMCGMPITLLGQDKRLEIKDLRFESETQPVTVRRP